MRSYRKRLVYLITALLVVLLCGCDLSGQKSEEIIETPEPVATAVVDESLLEIPVIEEPSAYDIWIESEISKPARHKYETIAEGFMIADDELSRGWLDDGTKNLIRLIKGDNISETATSMELYEIYKSLDENIEPAEYSIKDFFVTDDYGNSVNGGIYNFLETIDQLEMEKFNGVDVASVGESTFFDFDLVGGDEVVADALGISNELFQIILHAAVDAGFEVNFGE